MSKSCCQSQTGGRLGGAHRCWEVAGWLVPGALLALMPKCPACLAAYVLLLTGIGLSAATTKYVQIGLVGVCTVCLALLAVRRAYRIVTSRPLRSVGPEMVTPVARTSVMRRWRLTRRK